jgi:adenylosuccinate lyase
VQGEAMRAWNEEGDFRAAIEAHAEVRAHLSGEQIERAFSVERQLKNVDALFARVFGPEVA